VRTRCRRNAAGIADAVHRGDVSARPLCKIKRTNRHYWTHSSRQSSRPATAPAQQSGPCTTGRRRVWRSTGVAGIPLTRSTG
jgi:hypothetical protein